MRTYFSTSDIYTSPRARHIHNEYCNIITIFVISDNVQRLLQSYQARLRGELEADGFQHRRCYRSDLNTYSMIPLTMQSLLLMTLLIPNRRTTNQI